MRQMCQVKLSPDSMRQFNPAHLSHVGGDAAVDGNAQAARSNERGDARKRDGHRGHAANAVHNNEPLGAPRGMFDARVGRFFATLRVDILREPAKEQVTWNRKLDLLNPSVKTFRLEPRAFSGEKTVRKGARPPRYARGACQHAQNAVRAAISPPDNESRFRCRTRRSYLARERNATMAQISLAWMLCKKPWIIPIPGSRKPERLRENLGAAQVTLTAEEVARIDAALDGMDLAVFGGHARA